MSVIGIVGEYNPMHYGHLHHIAETKRLMGEDCPVVCAMSGDFIQRGEAAVYSKFARAEAAVMSGVDLVLELPCLGCCPRQRALHAERSDSWVQPALSRT